MSSGKFAIPMDLKSVPVTAQALQEQDALGQALLKWLEGHASVTIELRNQGDGKK